MCAQYHRPDGVRFSLQICRNSVEPPVSSRVRNLLAKDRDRAALAEEPKPRRPKVPCVGRALLLAGGAVALAGTTARPNRSVIGPPGESEGVAPTADPGEEVILDVPANVGGGNVLNVSLIDLAFGNLSRLDQFPQPRGGEGIVLVVVRRHYRRHVPETEIGNISRSADDPSRKSTPLTKICTERNGKRSPGG